MLMCHEGGRFAENPRLSPGADSWALQRIATRASFAWNSAKATCIARLRSFMSANCWQSAVRVSHENIGSAVATKRLRCPQSHRIGSKQSMKRQAG
jgi:hypothetical protein